MLSCWCLLRDDWIIFQAVFTTQIGISHDLLPHGDIIKSMNLPYLSALISMAGPYFLSVVTRYILLMSITVDKGVVCLMLRRRRVLYGKPFVVAIRMCGMSWRGIGVFLGTLSQFTLYCIHWFVWLQPQCHMTFVQSDFLIDIHDSQ